MNHALPLAVRLARMAVPAAILAGAATGAQAGTLYVYDDGTAIGVRLDRWQGFEATTNGALVADVSRSSGGGIAISGSFGGSSVPVPNTRGMAATGLAFLRSADIRDLQATVEPTSLVAMDNCSSSLTGTMELGLSGAFFNSSTTSHASDRTGDVVASLRLRRNATDTSSSVAVYATYGRCDDSACSWMYPYAEQYMGMATIGGGNKATLRITWDQPNHQFLYALNGAAAVSLAYAPLADRTPAHQPEKHLEAVARPVGCAAHAVPMSGGGYFTNVMTNLPTP